MILQYFTFLRSCVLGACMLLFVLATAQTSPKDSLGLPYKLARLDSLIDNKDYTTAEALLSQLKLAKDYTVANNRLAITLREAKVLYGTKNPEKALNLLLQNFNKIKAGKGIKSLYANQIGRFFYAAKNYPKAVAYYKMALNNIPNNKDITRVLRYYIGIGSSFYKNKQLDSAKLYYKKVIAFPLIKKTRPFISRAYNNLVVIAIAQNNYNLASVYSQASVKIKEQDKDTLGIAYALVNLGNIYYGAENLPKASASYLKAYKLVKKDSTKDGLKLKRDALYNLAYAYKDMGSYKKAVKYLLASTDLADHINKTDQAENLSAVEAKFNVAQKEKDLEIQKAKNLNTQILLYSLSFFVILIIVFGYIFIKNRQLKQKNRLDAVLSETQTKILNATIDAKEQERKSIAAILHDSVSALLSAANLHLQASKAQLKETPPIEIQKAQDIVGEASIKIRNLSHDLISSVLLKFGLAFAVHDLCQKYSNSEIFIHSQDQMVERYDQDFEIKMHSIIEELINNILKHSKAKNATVSLMQRADKKLVIQILDDGVGFDIVKAKQKDGLGLSHIEARVKMLKGRFVINTEIGEGSEISIIVPAKFKEKASNN
ncbi:MAG: tetratricopeptide repeat protein [Flavobacteriaceae bacterium]|nr:tetratricopeptide repeat protein [Flavobacteriaceae bacterium]